MSLRVVVYAEGGAELAGEWGACPAPGSQLTDDRLGPAHVLAKRSIALVRRLPEAAIRFDQGLKKKNAAFPLGSDLVDRRQLQRLLLWTLADMRPELAIVFVDEDGERARHAEMSGWFSGLQPGRPPTVIAVARQEFESWFVTDRACVSSVLARSFVADGDVEDWERRAAKGLLERSIEAASAPNPRDIRASISRHCDLEMLRKHSRSFKRFLDDLAGAPISRP